MKKPAIILAALFVLIILISCGEGRDEKEDNVGFYYEVESFKLDIGIKFEQLDIFIHEEKLHLLVLEEDKNTLNSYLHLLTMDADGTNVQEIYRTLIDESVDFFHIIGFEKHDDGYISLVSRDSVILPPNTREEFYDGLWGYESEYSYVYRKISPTGEIVSKLGIDAINNDSRQILITDVAFDKAGNAVISGMWFSEGGLGESLFLFNNGLTEDFHELADTRLTKGLFNHTNDGRVIVSSYALSSGTDMVMFYEIDFENIAITEGLEIKVESHIGSIGGVFPAPGESEFDFYFTANNRELYGYSKADESITLLLDLLVFSVPLSSGGDRSNLLLWDDGRITVVDWSWNGTTARNEATLYFLTPSDEPFISTQEIITLGWVNANTGWSPLRDRVGVFNRQNDTHRIEIVDYDFDVIDRLRTELIAGRGPDMIILSGSGANLTQSLAEGNFMLDLYQMIDKDPELNREDFFPSVLSAWENSRGELVQIASDFSIITLLGMQSVFPNAPESWNYADFIAFYQDARAAGYDYPIGMDMDRQQILSLLLFADDTFFCQQSAVANFDSKEFIDVLNFVITIPAEQGGYMIPQEIRLGGLWDPVGNLYNDEQLLLFDGRGIFSMQDFRVLQTRLGSITTFGYPSNDAPVHAAGYGISDAIGIRSNSPHTEAAWEFVRLSLLQSASNDRVFFPIRIDLFEKLIDYELSNKGRRGITTPTYSVEYWEMSESEADLLRELVSNIGHIQIFEHPIQNIVFEDVSAFFAGIRSAEDTARIIQSRVSIYLSERTG